MDHESNGDDAEHIPLLKLDEVTQAIKQFLTGPHDGLRKQGVETKLITAGLQHLLGWEALKDAQVQNPVVVETAAMSSFPANNMGYDVDENQRNPIVIESINQRIATASIKGEATKLRKEFGISERGTPIPKLCNVYSGPRMLPSDPCHSELAGVSKVALATLLDDMMTAKGKEQFLKMLHVFPMRQG
ncbi:hypothetical protein KEM56_000144 [Ascosphaera pollenicola]|nr:hypothetical protein KEM56_000144 [Ascosphaera pollenicola]